MKKTLAVAAPLLVAACAAHAQSAVTLYGIVEDGVDFASNVNGNHLVQTASGVTAGSRWGVRGTEDLGGGLSTIFRLESGFDINSGRLGSGLAFSRNAYVGIQSEQAGTVTLGRQWDSIVDYVEPYTLNGNIGGYYFAHPNDMDNTDNGFPISNAIKYRSPTIAGFTFGGLYAPGGIAGQFSNNTVYSAGGTYSIGAFSAGIGYLRINDPEVSTQGYQNYPGFTNAVYGNFLANARAQKVFGVGASYRVLTSLRLLADFTNTIFQQGSAGHDATFQNYELSGIYNPTSAVTIGAGYTYTTGRDHASDGEPKYSQFNLTVEYALSKRTSVYALGVFQKAAGDATVAQIAGFNPSSSQKQAVGRVGIRSVF
ncbi:porin [Paraburkholderia acidicola]|uniref:Porin n=1 Tax=Paraburkholderia acidicola TaxID=1912599 RepID=A0A2A4EUJ3_9BURK|nr:porin [Paraburkholderia acidicola]PCE24078.1 porin [Paraburkholderia acidicola]